MSHVRPGALIASIVFAVFAAYAFCAPATYRTSALIVVGPANTAAPVLTPEPLEAARRLGEAVLDRKALEQLSRERAAGSGPEANAQAASDVRRGLEIDTSDGHTFSIGYRDTNRARVQSACNLLARHAVELAPQVLVDHSAERALDLKRQQQTQELAAFLALHPQVAAEVSSSGSSSPDRDPALYAFHAEKSNLERRIAMIESGVVSDNPYVDPRESDVKLLRRRLSEIDSALDARRRAFENKPNGEALSPEVRSTWKLLLEGVTQSSAELDSKGQPELVARLVTPPPLPSSPIEPNRRLLLFFGAVFGIGLGAAFTLASRSAQIRRTGKPSRPPPAQPTQPFALGRQTLQLPSAPPVPSDLGPEVPVTQPQSHRAPPIVPIPQRSVSSSPPVPAADLNGKAGHSIAAPQPAPANDPARAGNTSSRPPARRFASTLVLPPLENPTSLEERTPDPVLASAEQAWDQQIRAHDVPGFAVVKAGSEPPPPAVAASAYLMPSPAKPPEVAPLSPAPAPRRANSRPPNQMKVTQPLGSFLPDAVWKSPANPTQLTSRRSSPMPSGPLSSSSESRYSYVSSSPPPPQASVPPSRSSSHPPAQEVVRIRPAPSNWQPNPELTPDAQRGLCEQLYPYAVESCFVVAVVGVPESTHYKSRVAVELALALAASGHPRVLLLEADFHRPWVQRMLQLDMPMGTGFSQQLRNRINKGDRTRWTVLAPMNSLHVLAEGVMRTPGLVLSRQFAEALKEMRAYYDLIIIDGPTSSLDVDSNALDSVIDGLITVCPAGGSPSVARLQALFSSKRFSAFATSR